MILGPGWPRGNRDWRLDTPEVLIASRTFEPAASFKTDFVREVNPAALLSFTASWPPLPDPNHAD